MDLSLKALTERTRLKVLKSGQKTVEGLTITRIGLAVFAAAALVLLIVSLSFFRSTAGERAELARQQVRVDAQRYADAAATYVRARTGIADQLANSAELAGLLASGNTEALNARVQQMRSQFPDAVRVQLVPPGVTGVDAAVNPPLSFAALDLLQQAEAKAEAPPIEVHQFGTEQQQVVLVRAIRASGSDQVRGLLLIGLSVPALLDSIKGMQIGYGELQQVISDDKPLLLTTAGDSSLRNDSSAVHVAVPGSRWQIAYWPAAAAGGESGGLYLIFALGLLALAAVVLGPFLWLGRVLHGDQAALINLIKDLRAGEAKANYPAKLADTRNTLELARHLLRGGLAQSDGAAAAKTAHGADPLAARIGTDGGTLGMEQVRLESSIFRAYDIRGVVETNLTPEVVYEIGRAIGSEAHERGQQAVIVGRDGRLSGPELAEALSGGLRASGRDVIDIGMVPTPLVYFATNYLDANSGVMLTGSHNPSEYNGMKIVIAGDTLSGDAIQGLRRRIQGNHFTSGQGRMEDVDVVADYIERIKSDVTINRPITVVVDCGNGVAGAVVPQLLEALGCEVIQLYCDVDGRFPNHHPDPGKPENLADLIAAVKEHGAELGLAFDGDGDRLGLVDGAGNIIWPDRLLMLFAMDILNRNPGAEILYDVKCSRHLPRIVSDFGGKATMWKTGHSLIKAKMKETGALLAGEMSGHVFFRERWFGFDDALYAAARLLEILSNDPRNSTSVFASLPDSVNTPELNVAMQEGEPYRFMERLLAGARFDGAEISTIDGLRADFDDGWGLVRASNTTPCLVLRFEADDEKALARIQQQFRQAMQQADPNIQLPF